MPQPISKYQSEMDNWCYNLRDYYEEEETDTREKFK